MGSKISSTIAAGLLLAISAAGAAAQTPGGQTGGTSGGTGSASSNGGQGDAGGTGQTGVRTLGAGRPAAQTPAAGSTAGDVSRSPMVGTGGNGNGGVLSGTTGAVPAAGTAPAAKTGGKLDGVASGKAP